MADGTNDVRLYQAYGNANDPWLWSFGQGVPVAHSKSFTDKCGAKDSFTKSRGTQQVQTRYFRTDQSTINTITAYNLALNDTTSPLSAGYGGFGIFFGSAYYGIRVWKVSSVGGLTEITAGTPVAQVSRSSAGSGEQTNTWSCPSTSLVATNAILVAWYFSYDDGGSWTLAGNSITEQLNANSLSAVTWTVSYWTYYATDVQGDVMSISWGDYSTYYCRIANFTYNKAGNFYSHLFTDMLGGKDTTNRIAVRLRSFNDKLGSKDTRTRVKSIYRTFTDKVGALDSKSRFKSITKLLTDKLGMNDTKNRFKTMVHIFTDKLGLKDMPENAVGIWHFDEGSGITAYDNSGNGNNGTLEGSPLPSWVAGKYGQALSFIGGSNDVKILHSSSLVVSDVTIVGWIYLTSVPSGYYDVWDNSHTGGYGTAIGYYLIGSDLIGRWYRGNGVSEYSYASINPIPLNGWHFIVVVAQGNTVTHYLDGILNGQTTYAQAIADCGDTLYFAHGWGGLTGVIDEVRIYNRVLSQTEIDELYRLNLFSPRGIATRIRSFTDKLGGKDTKSRVAVRVRSFTDKLGGKDTRTRVKSIYRTFTDKVGALDSKSRFKSITKLLTDKLGMNDTKNRFKTMVHIFTDKLGLKDMPENAVGIWHFDEGSGITAYDNSGNGNNGTLEGSPLPSWVAGKYGQALSFIGGSNDVKILHSSSLVVSDVTIVGWIYLTSVPSGYYDVWDNSHTGGYGTAIGYYLIGSDLIGRWYRGNGVSEYSYASINPIPLNGWHFIVVVAQGNTVTHYLDGILNGQTTYAQAIADCGDTLYFAHGWGGLTGVIDEVRIYNRVLSQTEIDELYRLNLFSPRGIATRIRSFTDKLGGKDTKSRVAVRVRSFTDKLGGKDTKSRVAVRVRSFTDKLGGKDSFSRFLIKVKTKTENIGVILEKLHILQTYSTDVQLKKIMREIDSIDVVFEKLGIQKTDSISVLFEKLKLTKTDSVSVLFQMLKLTKTDSIDVVFKRMGITKTDSISVLFKELGVTKTDSIDVLFKKLNIPKIDSIDVLLKKIVPKIESIDVLLKELGISKTDSIGILFKKLNISKTDSISVLTALRLTKSDSLDVLLKRLGLTKAESISVLTALRLTKSDSIDVLFKEFGIHKMDSIDVLFKKLNIPKTYNIDALFKKLKLTKTDSIGVLFKKLDISKTDSIDVLLKELGVKETDSIDVLFKRLNIPKTESVDVLLKELNIQKTEQLNVIFKRLGIKTVSNADVLFKMIGVEKTDDIDVILKKLKILKTLQADVLFKELGLTKKESIDVLFYLRLTLTDSVDVLLKRLEATKIDSLNVLFKKLNISGFTEYEHQNSEEGLIYGVIFGTQWYAQTFTPTITHEVTIIKLFMQTSGSNLAGLHFYVDIYATSGGFPTGAPLTSTGPLDPTGLWAPFCLKVFEVPTFILTADTMYAIVCHMYSGDADHEIDWEYNINNPYTSGSYCRSEDSGVTWGYAIYGDYDFVFELWGAKPPLAYGLSVVLKNP